MTKLHLRESYIRDIILESEVEPFGELLLKLAFAGRQSFAIVLCYISRNIYANCESPDIYFFDRKRGVIKTMEKCIWDPVTFSSLKWIEASAARLFLAATVRCVFASRMLFRYDNYGIIKILLKNKFVRHVIVEDTCPRAAMMLLETWRDLTDFTVDFNLFAIISRKPPLFLPVLKKLTLNYNHKDFSYFVHHNNEMHWKFPDEIELRFNGISMFSDATFEGSQCRFPSVRVLSIINNQKENVTSRDVSKMADLLCLFPSITNLYVHMIVVGPRSRVTIDPQYAAMAHNKFLLTRDNFNKKSLPVMYMEKVQRDRTKELKMLQNKIHPISIAKATNGANDIKWTFSMTPPVEEKRFKFGRKRKLPITEYA